MVNTISFFRFMNLIFNNNIFLWGILREQKVTRNKYEYLSSWMFPPPSVSSTEILIPDLTLVKSHCPDVKLDDLEYSIYMYLVIWLLLFILISNIRIVNKSDYTKHTLQHVFSRFSSLNSKIPCSCLIKPVS